MHQECVLAEFTEIDHANRALEVLWRAGYDEEDISIISKADHPAMQRVTELEVDERERTGIGSASTGAAMGGAISFPIAIGSMVGPFFIAGPLLGAGLGAAVGLMGGAHKIAEDKALAPYQVRVEQGSLLILLAGEEEAMREAEASLKTVGPVTLKRFRYTGDLED